MSLVSKNVVVTSLVADVDETKFVLILENGNVMPLVSEAGIDSAAAATVEETMAVLV